MALGKVVTPDPSSGSSSPTTSSVSAAAAAVPSLPLGWTQINRKKRKRVNGGAPPSASSSYCNDPSCPADADGDGDGDGYCKVAVDQRGQHKAPEKRLDQKQQPVKSQSVRLKGKALFCLHTLDCTWFQGQFVNSNSHPNSNSSVKGFKGVKGVKGVKSLGLLAQQREDIDDCLQCSDGGYREIDLSILSKKQSLSDGSGGTNAGAGSGAKDTRKNIVMEKLSCTGGDMLRIRTGTPFLEESTTRTHDTTSNGEVPLHVDNVTFDAERIITGARVESLVRRYFPNLVPLHSNAHGSFLEQLPDCAVVVGAMTLCLPREFLSEYAHGLRKNDNDDDDDDDDDDGWLE